MIFRLLVCPLSLKQVGPMSHEDNVCCYDNNHSLSPKSQKSEFRQKGRFLSSERVLFIYG
jgi:hypothetical protein